jgi:hypothetical protein
MRRKRVVSHFRRTRRIERDTGKRCFVLKVKLPSLLTDVTQSAMFLLHVRTARGLKSNLISAVEGEI